MTQWVKNLTAVACVTMEVRVCSLAQWVKGSSSATAAAWIQSLAWELTYAVGEPPSPPLQMKIFCLGSPKLILTSVVLETEEKKRGF